MWPLLATATVAVLVIAERAFWWMRMGARTESRNLQGVYEALEVGDVPKASALCRDSQDPVLQVIWHGLNHHHTSLENALQVAAGAQIEQAGRFLSVLDTIITLAPLLGLLGTVTGIMGAFHFVGNEEVAAVKVSGGIAEALIATAAGLTTAIVTLLPFNFFNARLAKFMFVLQTAATNVEVLLKAAPKTAGDAK
jgi:biopolymer transport protein ExbB